MNGILVADSVCGARARTKNPKDALKNPIFATTHEILLIHSGSGSIIVSLLGM